VIARSLWPAMQALKGLTPAQRAEAIEDLFPLDARVLDLALRYEWPIHARAKQLPPTDDTWRTWVVCAGRMFGKTRTGAEATRAHAESGVHEWMTLVGPTREMTRKVLVEGPVGVMAVCPPWYRPTWEPTKLLIEWPPHPVTRVVPKCRVYSADDPDRVVGEQHSWLWCDELSVWKKAADSWAHLSFGLRVQALDGSRPTALITMTPRLTNIVTELLLGKKVEATGQRVQASNVRVVTGTSYENKANVDPEALKDLERRYGGSRFGRQEILGELLGRVENALFKQEFIDDFRLPGITVKLVRRIVVVDPTRARFAPRDLAGIIVMARGADGHCYVIEDATLRGSPLQWLRRAVDMALKYSADAIVYEMNRLPAEIQVLVRQVGEESGTHWIPVQSKETKEVRAAAVSPLYEAGRVHHVGDALEALETEMVTWDPSEPYSPDRLDALVIGVRELLLSEMATRPPLVVLSGA